MNLLCFDISSGGISAAVFDARLSAKQFAESQWVLETGSKGAATLPIAAIESQFKKVISELRITSVDALCIGSFMHNILQHKWN